MFAAHFSELARRSDVAAALVKVAADPAISTRMNAIKGLWQFWFWTADLPVKEQIEDTLLAQLGKPQPEWVARNLDHAIYNVADKIFGIYTTIGFPCLRARRIEIAR